MDGGGKGIMMFPSSLATNTLVLVMPKITLLSLTVVGVISDKVIFVTVNTLQVLVVIKNTLSLPTSTR